MLHFDFQVPKILARALEYFGRFRQATGCSGESWKLIRGIGFE